MFMTLYKRIFENALQPQDISPESDAQTFKQGFENEQDFQNLEQEIQQVTLTPEEIDAVVKRGQQYSQKITAFASLLDQIQKDVLKGVFKSVQAKDMEKFAPLKNDLIRLGIALTNGVADTIIKTQSDEKKK